VKANTVREKHKKEYEKREHDVGDAISGHALLTALVKQHCPEDVGDRKEGRHTESVNWQCGLPQARPVGTIPCGHSYWATFAATFLPHVPDSSVHFFKLASSPIELAVTSPPG
jgi:hypothetical protein